MVKTTVLIGTLVSALLSTAAYSDVFAASSVDSELQSARELVQGDKYLRITQLLQCRDIGPDGNPVGPGSGNQNATVEPTQVFDNLYYVGGTRTGSWVLTTSDGYIMIDAMYGDSPEKVIVPGLRKLGLDPSKIKYIVITHAGPDHAGGARYFQERYGTKIVMSAEDWDGILSPRPGSWLLDTRPKEQRPPQEREWVGSPRKDIAGVDGQKLALGNTTVTLLSTPRRVNGGGLSIIAPVTDHGQPHTWGTFGNTNFPATRQDRQVHRDSVAYFLKAMEAAKVDAVTSSHPFVDGSDLRMEELRRRQAGQPNPFVIGEDAASRYLKIIGQCTALMMARADAGLDDVGQPLAAGTAPATRQ